MILIVGAGLSGLLTAYRLKEHNIPFKVLEARNRLGGRIHSVEGKLGTPMEMGATWFTDEHTNLLSLIEELGLDYFQQYNGGHYYYYSPGNPNHGKYPLIDNSNSYRLVGGTGSLISSLMSKVGKENIFLGFKLNNIEILSDSVEVHSNQTLVNGKKVILTIPPKVWYSQIKFSPDLPDSLKEVAKTTQTWMEDSTKVAIEYDNPFWRGENNPAIVVSNNGPFIECYDHSNKDESKYALCGFVNPSYNGFSRESRLEAITNQLKYIYGDVALTYSDYHETIWKDDRYTKAFPNEVNYPHQNNGHAIFRDSYFNDRLIFSGTETASIYPGYMEGAVVSSNEVVNRLL